MPLDQSGSCQGFHSNVRHLVDKFKSEGDSPEKARERAVATAAKIMKDKGGDPSSCTSGD